MERIQYAQIGISKFGQGTHNKLIVELNTFIFNDLKWKNGVILQDIETNSYAEITESWQEKHIALNLKGNNIEVLFGRIFNALQSSVQDLKNAKLLNQLSFEIEANHEGIWYMIEEESNQMAIVTKNSFLKEKYRHALEAFTKIEILQLFQTNPTWAAKEALIAILKGYDTELAPSLVLEMAHFVMGEWEVLQVTKNELAYT